MGPETLVKLVFVLLVLGAIALLAVGVSIPMISDGQNMLLTKFDEISALFGC